MMSIGERKRLKVGYVLSYNPPNYVRTEAILDMLSRTDFKVYTAANKWNINILRHLDTLCRLIMMRLRHHPDVYILGFRGHELFWPVRFLTFGKPLIFDEFINMYLWAVDEHAKTSPGSAQAKLIGTYSRQMLRSADHVLSDTTSHAQYSAEQAGLSPSKFTPLYVGTNETLFVQSKKPKATEKFEVFYYGSKFLPLHGIDVVLEAAARLSDSPVHFTIIGGGNDTKIVKNFRAQVERLNLKNVTHLPRVPYEELHAFAAKAQLCLGGPFGNTPQSRVVITGKTFQFLSMAKPVVVGENTETKSAGLVDKKNCLLVKRGDSKSLAAAIRWAYEHQRSLEPIGNAGKKLYDQRLSVAAQKDKLAQVIETLATSR